MKIQSAASNSKVTQKAMKEITKNRTVKQVQCACVTRVLVGGERVNEGD
jgi:hypothetical protein